jgi:ATP-dependent DNA helicase DinG
MGYGRRLRAALPPMTPLGSEQEALAWLRMLADDHAATPRSTEPV